MKKLGVAVIVPAINAAKGGGCSAMPKRGEPRLCASFALPIAISTVAGPLLERLLSELKLILRPVRGCWPVSSLNPAPYSSTRNFFCVAAVSEKSQRDEGRVCC
jgi:hypothetical protein